MRSRLRADVDLLNKKSLLGTIESGLPAELSRTTNSNDNSAHGHGRETRLGYK